METNFFKQLEGLNLSGDVQLTIAKGAEGRYVVSVMLLNTGCSDKAANLLRPLNLRGNAAELDKGFFTDITTPLQAASGLLSDMAGFMQQLETVKKQSAIEKEKGGKEKRKPMLKTRNTAMRLKNQGNWKPRVNSVMPIPKYLTLPIIRSMRRK